MPDFLLFLMNIFAQLLAIDWAGAGVMGTFGYWLSVLFVIYTALNIADSIL